MVAVEGGFLLFLRLIVPILEVPRGIKLTRSELKVVSVMVKPDPKLVRLLVCVDGGGTQAGAVMV
jgi:hypothetical protein